MDKLPRFKNKHELQVAISSAFAQNEADWFEPVFIDINNPVGIKFKIASGHVFKASTLGCIRELDGIYEVSTLRTENMTRMINCYIEGDIENYQSYYGLLMLVI